MASSNTTRITARYPGTCRCGARVRKGADIEYGAGQIRGCAACSYTGRAKGGAAAPKASRPAEPRKLQAGEQEIGRPSRGRDDGYVVGATVHLLRVSGGGGPDGRYWTVTAAGKVRDEDDEWQCWAHVRPATEAEWRPLVEASARKARREAAIKRVVDLVQGPAARGREAGEQLAAVLCGLPHEVLVSGRGRGGIWEAMEPHGFRLHGQQHLVLGFERHVLAGEARTVGCCTAVVLEDALLLYLDRSYWGSHHEAEWGPSPGPELRRIGLTAELRDQLAALTPPTPEQGEHHVERVVIQQRSGGLAEVLYVGRETVRYVEPRYDDAPAEWTARITDELRAALDELRAVLA